jgi:hypothetical protein
MRNHLYAFALGFGPGFLLVIGALILLGQYVAATVFSSGLVMVVAGVLQARRRREGDRPRIAMAASPPEGPAAVSSSA